MICTVFARTRLPSLDAIVQTGLIYHLDEVLASGKDAKKSEVWQIPFTTPLPEPSQGCNLFNFFFFGGGWRGNYHHRLWYSGLVVRCILLITGGSNITIPFFLQRLFHHHLRNY